MSNSSPALRRSEENLQSALLSLNAALSALEAAKPHYQGTEGERQQRTKLKKRLLDCHKVLGGEEADAS